jgi:GGDEF domain-containing protein
VNRHRRLPWTWVASLLALVLVLWCGSVFVQATVLRDTLTLQQSSHNRDAAARWAAELSRQGSDPSVLRAAAAELFPTVGATRLALRAADGNLWGDFVAPPASQPTAHGPLAAWLTLPVTPGSALVGPPQQPLAELWVELPVAPAQAALQAGLLRAAWAGAGWALLVAALALGMVWRWRAPWQAALTHAAALEQGALDLAPEPHAAEPRQFTRGMNALVLRLRQAFDAQAQQVASLQRQAQADTVTGLPRREQFMAQLKELLADVGAPMASLLLVRAQRLDAINQRLGHDDTNRLLCAVADVLGTYVTRVPGSFAGRLNGSDFALCLPAPGVARETGESLLATLLASPLGRNASAEWAVGALEGVCARGAQATGGEPEVSAVSPVNPVSAVLAAADAALAEAEAEPTSAMVLMALAESVADPAGARAWRTQISQALTEGRVQLGEEAVSNAQGQVLHLQCTLQVQLQAGGDFQAARRWLALAARSRLLPQVDLAAVDLALQAIRIDGHARAVRVAAVSLAAPEFANLVQQRLRAAPEAAANLWLEVSDDLPRRLVPAAQGAVALWRTGGAHVGVEHAGAPASALVQWQGLGIEVVKVAHRHLQGAADDPVVHDYAASLLALVQGLGAQAMAEGMDDARDLQALWALGFNGASGEAARH